MKNLVSAIKEKYSATFNSGCCRLQDLTRSTLHTVDLKDCLGQTDQMHSTPLTTNRPVTTLCGPLALVIGVTLTALHFK